MGDTNGFLEFPVPDYDNEINIGALSLDESARQEQLRRHVTSSDISQTAKKERVQLITLDSLDLPCAHLVKIDVEGMELEVIRGGLGWLARSQWPPLLFEVWDDNMPGADKRQALFELLKQLGYDIFIVSDLCIAQHEKRRYFTFQTTHDETTRNTSLTIHPITQKAA